MAAGDAGHFLSLTFGEGVRTGREKWGPARSAPLGCGWVLFCDLWRAPWDTVGCPHFLRCGAVDRNNGRAFTVNSKLNAVFRWRDCSPSHCWLRADLGRSSTDRLTYDIEWRLIHAGSVVVDAQKTSARMKLESAGMVSSLFKVEDAYGVTYDEPFCATSSTLDAQEGKRHRETRVTYDRTKNRADYMERDVVEKCRAAYLRHCDSELCPRRSWRADQFASADVEPGPDRRRFR